MLDKIIADIADHAERRAQNNLMLAEDRIEDVLAAEFGINLRDKAISIPEMALYVAAERQMAMHNLRDGLFKLAFPGRLG
jgi:hypothetical protein